MDKCAALAHPLPTLAALAPPSSPLQQQRFIAKATSPAPDASRIAPSSRAIRRRNSPVKYRGVPTGQSDKQHYLTHRLRLAGCELPVFEPPAIEALFHSARALPRLINRIAHYAMTAAALNNARTVNAEHLEHAIEELRL